MKTYECIDRLNCRFSDCRFHIICSKYHKQRDMERRRGVQKAFLNDIMPNEVEWYREWLEEQGANVHETNEAFLIKARGM